MFTKWLKLTRLSLTLNGNLNTLYIKERSVLRSFFSFKAIIPGKFFNETNDNFNFFNLINSLPIKANEVSLVSDEKININNSFLLNS